MYLIKVTFSKFVDVLELLIFIRVILSYVPSAQDNTISKWIYQLSEPLLSPVREILYRIGLNKGMIDFSPIFTFLLLGVIKSIVLNIL